MEALATPPERHNAHIPQCCCGRIDCPFLAHTGTLLEGLERDVSTAAQLGQALLVRHEAYIFDSEQERARMTATIEALEKDKRDLEARNARMAEENDSLLEQLDGLNEAVVDSDAQIKILMETLEATQAELARVSVLAMRTEALENELALLEREQGQLQDTLSNTKEDEQSAVQRWRTAERMICSLQDQIDRIEREARQERERHVEVIGRMERRRAMENELQSAAGRLKGAAAAKTTGSNVVSHFVKDILQDNANLQMGIVELREMLMNSNEEVELLREQLQFHQPISPNQDCPSTPTLQKELEVEPVVNQELHVHHHYHAPPQPKEELIKARALTHRRVRKKSRNVITSGHFTPPSQSRNPSVSKVNGSASSTKSTSAASSAAILSQTSVTIPSNAHRWSIQSNQTTASTAFSSVPSSPTLNSHRNSSIFDRVFSDIDSSRPTSPESNDPGSPMFLPSNGPQDFTGKLDASLYKHSRKSPRSLKPPLGQLRSVSMPITVQSKSTPITTTITELSAEDRHSDTPLDVEEFYLSPGHPTIPEENEETSDNQSFSTTTPTTDISTEDIYSSLQSRPGLRRHASHESMISVSGMDIHTLQAQPSQRFLANNPRFAAASTSITSSKPVLSAMTATATRANLSRASQNSSAYTRSLLYGAAADQRGGLRAKPSRETLSQRVGGWVFGKWGFTPATSASASTTSSPPPSRDSSTPTVKFSKSDTDSLRPVSKDEDKAKLEAEKAVVDPLPPKPRAPGINQAGPLLGFFQPARDSSTPTVKFSKSATDSSRPVSKDEDKAKLEAEKATVDPLPLKPRAPGINQAGPLLGFFQPAQEAPVQVVVEDVDHDALAESLGEA